MTENALPVPPAARVLPRVSRRRRAQTLLVVGALLGLLAVNVGHLTAKVKVVTNRWATSDEAGQDSNTAESQPGQNDCEGTWGIPAEDDPGWVRVGGDGSPDAAIVRADGQILDPDATNFPMDPGIEKARHTNSWPNFTDNMLNHWNRDFNIFLTLDETSKHLLAEPGQFLEGDDNEIGNLEVEWERGTVPEFAMPAVGDRLAVWGAHIWDCGHGDTWAQALYPGDPESDLYRAEIHPPMGWVAYRQTADADGKPQNGKQDQNPWKWYEATDLQGMAETLPNTWLRNTPVHATVADAYFSSYGGNVIESLNGCANGAGPAIQCWDNSDRPELHFDDSFEWQQKVLNNDYEFFVPAPPKPAGAETWSKPVWDVEERCGEIPPDPTHAYKNHPESESDGGVEGTEQIAGRFYWSEKGIGAATCNSDSTANNTPPFTVEETEQNNQRGFMVTVRAKTGQDKIDGTADDPVYPSNDYVAFAYRFKVAWDVAPLQPATTVQVDFDAMHVYNDAEGACTSDDGEWVMMLRANDQSVYPVNGEGDDNDDLGPGDDPFWEAGAVDDERECVGGVDDDYKTYDLGTGDANTDDNLTRFVQLAPGQKVNIWERTYDKDPSDDETLDVVDEFLLAPPLGQPDSYTFGTKDDDHWGSHTIDVKLTNVTEPSVESDLVVGDPKFGPNQHTGGVMTRISGQTPLSVVPKPGNDLADGAQYRIWMNGSAPPAQWAEIPGVDQAQVDLGSPFAGLPTGEYWISVAALRKVPNSGDLLVGEHSSQLFQVDTTPPKLTVPADILVPATETGGAHVDFVAAATDNFDPQPVFDNPNGNPTVTCDHHSGDLFPQGLNEPKTTPVTCTATDAVGNTAMASFKVTVYSPFGYMDDFVILGWQWAEIGPESHVFSGNVGAYDSSDGVAHAPLGYPNIELATGKDTVVEPHSKLAAESIWLEADTHAGGVWWVDEFNTGAGATYTSYPGYVPLWACPAEFPVFSASGLDLTFSSDTSIAPGTFGRLIVMPGVTLKAAGGDYYVESITLMHDARLEVERPARFHVDETVVVDDNGYIGPRPGVSLYAHDIEMYATGIAGASTPAFSAANDVVLTLNLQTRDGLLQVGHRATATGAFLGPMVQFGRAAQLYLDSVFTADYCDNFPAPRPEPAPCYDGSGAPIPCPPPRPPIATRDG